MTSTLSMRRAHRSVVAVVASALLLVGARADAQQPQSGSNDATAGVAESGGATSDALLSSTSVDPSTGIMHTSLAIAAPKARGAAQPGISISYSSEAGDGYLGWGSGWDLDLPEIVRHPRSGPPTYEVPPTNVQSWTPKDDFYIGGTRLLPVCVVRDGSCAQRPDEQFLNVPTNSWYFREETEHSFNRYFFSPDQLQWIVQSKSGVTAILGKLGLSQTLVPTAIESDATGHPYRWHVVAKFDSQGSGGPIVNWPGPNSVIYIWGLAWGSLAPQPGQRMYLWHVFDTMSVDAASRGAFTWGDFAHHIAFKYEAPPWTPPWGGAATFTPPIHRAPLGMRVSGIDVTSAGSDGGRRALVRRYHFTYHNVGRRSFLDKVQMEGRCNTDVFEVDPQSNPVLPATSCLMRPETDFFYTDSSGVDGWYPRAIAGALPASPFFADINTDGFPDFVGVSDGSGSQGVSLDNWLAPDNAAVSTTVTGKAWDLQFTGDFAGNGKLNVLWFDKGTKSTPANQWASATSPIADGTAWKWSTDQISDLRSLLYTSYGPDTNPCDHDHDGWQYPHLVGEVPFATGDVDGDGYPDLVTVTSLNLDACACNASPGLCDPTSTTPSYWHFQPQVPPQVGIAIHASDRVPNGTLSAFDRPLGNQPPPSWAKGYLGPISNFAWVLPQSQVTADGHVVPEDMNGDGLADIAYVQKSGITFGLGYGDGTFVAPGALGIAANVPGLTITDASRVWLHDLNGDGMADIVQMTDTGFNVFFNRDGLNFDAGIAETVPSTVPTFTAAKARVLFADVNGSGVEDLVVVQDDIQRAWYVDFYQGNRPGLLTDIFNPQGAHTSIAYATTPQLGYQAFKNAPAWSRHMGQVLHHVTSISVTNHVSGPFATTQTKQYTYRDPVYDPRERRFVGFSTVREVDVGGTDNPTRVVDTTYLSGLCEIDDPSVCPIDPIDPAYRALAALPVTVETSDGNGKYLSTTHTTWTVRNTVTGANGIAGRMAFPQSVDTYLYDTASASSGTSSAQLTQACIEDAKRCFTTSLTLRSGSPVHLGRTMNVSPQGNPTESVDLGQVGVDAPLDLITTWIRPAGDSTGWTWRKLSESLSAVQVPGPFADVSRFVQYAYDAHGNIKSITRQLSGSAKLDRHDAGGRNPAPTPSTVSSEGAFITAETYTYDNFGNLQQTKASDGSACGVTTYDPIFKQLPVRHDTYVVSPSTCSGPAMTTSATYDRGLAATKMVTNTDLSYATTTYDTFGRPSTVSRNGTTAPNGQTVRYFYTDFKYANAAWTPSSVETQTWDGTAYRRAVTFVDGMGTTLIRFRQAAKSDAPYTWVASGAHRYGARGQAVDEYQPFFTSTDPAAFFSSGPTLGTSSRHTSYDAFGRVISTRGLDGVQDSEAHYHALSIDSFDANHLPASKASSYSTIVKDGHGRTVQSIVRGRVGASTAVSTTTTSYAYTASGKATQISRTDGKTTVTQNIKYDSLDRLVESRDPNSTDGTHDWRFVYDNFDRLVGTSDPRGCGENIAYDAAGRKIGEDYSPCDLNHPDYTPVGSDGLGYESYFRYDADPQQNVPVAADGKLHFTIDRGSFTIYDYDLRGRLATVTRALTKPGAPSTFASMGDLAANTFQYTMTYDDTDRVLSRSTGANAPELLANGKSVVNVGYDERGHVASVNSSYGSLVSSTRFDADELPLKYQYADAANTASAFDYDARRRLFHSKILRAPGWVDAIPKGDASTRESSLQELTLSYDAVANPTKITDTSDSDTSDPSAWPAGAKPIHTKTIGYDDLYHVTSVSYDTAGDSFTQPFAPEFAEESTGSSPLTASPVTAAQRNTRVTSQTFDYDGLGNITASSDDSQTFYDRSLGTIGHDPAAPNRMVSATHPNGKLSVGYDAEGNVTNIGLTRSNTTCVVPQGCAGSLFEYEWDELGRLSSAVRADPSGKFLIRRVRMDFTYDASGKRVLKATTIGSQPTTYGAEIFPTLRLDGATWDDTAGKYQDDATTEGVYLVATSAPLARLAYAASDPRTSTSGNRHVFLELKDALGSSAFVIDWDTGELVERTTYQPYGAVESDFRTPRWSNFREVYKFTGAEEDVGIGASYFGGRYYAPALGRFLSADPMAIHAQQGDLNPYAYVAGRVFRAIDPTGLDGEEVFSGPLPYVADAASYINEAVSALYDAEEALSGFAAGYADGLLFGVPSMVGMTEVPTDTTAAMAYVGGEVAGMGTNMALTSGLASGADAVNAARIAGATADVVDAVETAEAVNAVENVANGASVAVDAAEAGQPLMSAAAEAPIADVGEMTASAVATEATSGTQIVQATAAADPVVEATEMTGVQANKVMGDAAADELANTLRDAGLTVEREVPYDTPIGRRMADLRVSEPDGTVRGLIEVKVGDSEYTVAQRLKDFFIESIYGHSTDVVRYSTFP